MKVKNLIARLQAMNSPEAEVTIEFERCSDYEIHLRVKSDNPMATGTTIDLDFEE